MVRLKARSVCAMVAALGSFSGVLTATAPPSLGASAPLLSLGDVRVMQPSAAGTAVLATVPVVLNMPATAPVSFAWSVATGNTDAGGIDAASGGGSIGAGSQGTTIDVPVHYTATSHDVDEIAPVTITSVSGASVERGTGRVIVRQAIYDGIAPGFVMGDVKLREPESGAVTVRVPVGIPSPQHQDVSLSWRLQSQYTGRVGSDMPTASGIVTIPRGAVSSWFTVTVNGDTTPEPQETLLLVATGSSGLPIADPIGLVVIWKDDAAGIPLPWTAPYAVRSGPPTVYYDESSLGDWVGGGTSVGNTRANSGISIRDRRGEFDMRVDGDVDTSLTFYIPGDRRVHAGAWTGVPRALSIYDTPGFSVDQAAAGCNSSRSTVVVDRVSRSDTGALLKVVLRFEQFCDGRDQPLRGYVRWVRGDPTKPPPAQDPADFPWRPPAGTIPSTGNWLYTEGTPGEYVTGGATQLAAITSADKMNISRGGFTLDEDSVPQRWFLAIGMPTWQPKLTRGWYPAQYGALENPTKAALLLEGSGRGCNAVIGDVVVDAAQFNSSGVVTSLRLRFRQYCDDNPNPVYGVVQWSRSG